MLKKSGRSHLKSCKLKGGPGTNLLQDMNFLCLKEFYNSIPDYSDINHLPEKEFYRELDNLKKKQQELTCCKKKSRKSRSSHNNRQNVPHGCDLEKRNFTERISFADDGNSISSWQLEFGSITCKKRENGNQSRLSSAATSRSRPQTSRAESRCRKQQQSRLSNIHDDYEMLKELKNYRSKSISPTRSQINQQLKNLEENRKYFSGEFCPEKPPSAASHSPHIEREQKRDPIKEIPITSRIPLFDKVMEDQARKNRLAKLNSAIKLTSKIKPFHFHESTRKSKSRCLNRSFSSPHLKFSDDDTDDECPSKNHSNNFKAKPFPKNLFCNYYHYKMWEDNYFRALNKKLRAEELLKISKLPPSMAKREVENKKKVDPLEEFEVPSCQAETPDISKSVEIVTPQPKKSRKIRRKIRRSKSALNTASKTRTMDTKYFLDSKASDITETEKSSIRNHREDTKSMISITPAPIYPVNRPNLAATLRFQISRKKLQKYRENRELLNRDSIKRPTWGVKQTHAFQQLRNEATHDEEIALRLATRRAEQKLRQEEHEINMEIMKQRVKTAPLLLEGPPQLGSRLGHIYHHCDIAEDKKKVNNLLSQQNVTRNKSKENIFLTPGSMISIDDSKQSETGSINSKYS